MTYSYESLTQVYHLKHVYDVYNIRIYMYIYLLYVLLLWLEIELVMTEGIWGKYSCKYVPTYIIEDYVIVIIRISHGYW